MLKELKKIQVKLKKKQVGEINNSCIQGADRQGRKNIEKMKKKLTKCDNKIYQYDKNSIKIFIDLI